MLERVEGIEDASVMIVEEDGRAVSAIVVYSGGGQYPVADAHPGDRVLRAGVFPKEKVQVYLS